ncbi:MAG: LruC domain-containing protein [Nitritalea sp.]
MTKLFSSFVSIGLIGLLWSPLAQAQVVLDNELGAVGQYRTICWEFNSINIHSSVDISGNHIARTTSPVNTATIGDQSLLTPWLNLSAGNITFKLKTDGNSATVRNVHVSFIPFAANASGQKGTPQHFFSANLDAPTDIRLRTYSVPVPAELIGKSGKIMVSFTGNGGNGRIALDDLVVPGRYASDPTKNCTLDTSVTPAADITSSIFGTSGFSTVMFEDLWPGLGDYDFNDLVVNLKAEKTTTAAGILKEIKLTVLLKAAGAAFDNSFGIAFPGIPTEAVESVSGTLKGGMTSFSYLPSGAEANQTRLSVIVIESVHALIPTANNTLLTGNAGTMPELAPFEVLIKIKGSAALSGTTVTAERVDPFLIANQTRGREVHLPGRSGTDLVDPSLYGTAADNSEIGVSYTSKTTNLPWAILIPEEVPFMQEAKPITEGFLKMSDWAKSKGTSFVDWFSDKPGYRNNEKFFGK